MSDRLAKIVEGFAAIAALGLYGRELVPDTANFRVLGAKDFDLFFQGPGKELWLLKAAGDEQNIREIIDAEECLGIPRAEDAAPDFKIFALEFFCFGEFF